jgi:hypothetical protein
MFTEIQLFLFFLKAKNISVKAGTLELANCREKWKDRI